MDRRLAAEAAMPLAYFEILRVLRDCPDGVPMRCVAERTRTSLSRLSHAMSRLVESGWAERRVAPGDLRTTLVALTAAGRRVTATAATVHDRAVAQAFLDVLPRDRRTALAEACRILLDHRPERGS